MISSVPYGVQRFPSRLTVDTAVDEQGETRRRSAALFGNEKTVEVVLALQDEGTATAQMILARTGIGHSMVRDALGRLVEGGVVRALPKTGGTRSPQYYQPISGRVWDTLLATVQALSQEIRNTPSGPSPATSRSS
jgi:ribosomal protein S25